MKTLNEKTKKIYEKYKIKIDNGTATIYDYAGLKALEEAVVACYFFGSKPSTNLKEKRL